MLHFIWFHFCKVIMKIHDPMFKNFFFYDKKMFISAQPIINGKVNSSVGQVL